MKIAVTDANIFIDLIQLGLLDLLFKVDLQIYTTHEVVQELNSTQQLELTLFAKSEQLEILHLSANELFDIPNYQQHLPKGLSFADMAVLFQAENKQALVLTGDWLLRKTATARNIEVHGIIWIFDVLVESGLVSAQMAAEKMEELLSINRWLPQKECKTRIEKWISKPS